MRLEVVELQEHALGAPSSVWGDEAALSPVPAPSHTLGLVWHVSGRVPIRPGTDRTRLRGRPELCLLDLLEEQGNRTIEDRAGVAVRNLAAKERL
jgi:hypothetical protein